MQSDVLRSILHGNTENGLEDRHIYHRKGDDPYWIRHSHRLHVSSGLEYRNPYPWTAHYRWDYYRNLDGFIFHMGYLLHRKDHYYRFSQTVYKPDHKGSDEEVPRINERRRATITAAKMARQRIEDEDIHTPRWLAFQQSCEASPKGC